MSGKERGMGEGLRPHWCKTYLYDVKYYYDHKKGCMVKDAKFRCMICGRERHEYYEYRPPPVKEKCRNKVLEKNKRKYSNY